MGYHCHKKKVVFMKETKSDNLEELTRRLGERL
jgi:hypothetical protein